MSKTSSTVAVAAIPELGNEQIFRINGNTKADHSNELMDQRRDKGALKAVPLVPQKTKSELLTGLMARPEVLDKVGAAWRLFIRLLLTSDGMLIGTHDEIAKQLGKIGKDSARNWGKHLAKEGIVEVTEKGWQVTVKLIGEYMTVAQAPERIHVPDQILAPAHADDAAFRKIREGTHALGGTMTITIHGCQFGG